MVDCMKSFAESQPPPDDGNNSFCMVDVVLYAVNAYYLYVVLDCATAERPEEETQSSYL